MRIESIAIKNYRVFKDAELSNLSGMSVLVGANGSGKSTLFDVFGFLRDALQNNVDKALARRGGFKEVRSREATGPIGFDIKFRDKSGPLVTYSLRIGLKDNRPVVERELLKYRRGQRGKPWHFLDFQNGRGLAVTNEEDYGKPDAEIKRDEQKLDSPDILAIKGLGQFQKFKVVSSFRKLIENWHVSNFHIEYARSSQDAGYAEHLNEKGENVALVAQFLYERHRDIFDEILKKMSERVPGVKEIKATTTEEGKILLRFQDGAFKDPFVARYVSDGTIKMFTYLVLLYDPSPHPLLCVEEPENQLYPKLLQELAEEFRLYARRGGQVFVSTHSPDLLNGVKLEEIFWLNKQNGYTSIKRLCDNKQIRALVEEGDFPGELWKQGFFENTGL